MSSSPTVRAQDDQLESDDTFDVFKTYSTEPASASYATDTATTDSASSNASSSTLTLNSMTTTVSQPTLSSYSSSSISVDDVPGIVAPAPVPAPVAAAPPALRLGPHQPKNQREIDRRSVYVSNIPFKISPWKLKVLFCQGTDTIKGCGKDSVNRVTIVCDRVTGLPKGYAYIEFASEESVADAVKFNGLEVDGRVIGVNAKRTNVPGVHSSNSGSGIDHDTLSKDIDRLHLFPDPSSTPNDDLRSDSDSNSPGGVSSTSIIRPKSSTATPNFYNSDSAKNYKNHRNSNYNFIKNANQIFNHRHHKGASHRLHNPKIGLLSRRLSDSPTDETSLNGNDCRTNHPLSSSIQGSRGGFRGHPRTTGRGGHRTHSTNNNNNKNSNINSNDSTNDSSSSSNSGSGGTPTNSKLVIDKYHYLTPSSRVGVYNHDSTSSANNEL